MTYITFLSLIALNFLYFRSLVQHCDSDLTESFSTHLLSPDTVDQTMLDINKHFQLICQSIDDDDNGQVAMDLKKKITTVQTVNSKIRYI